MKRYNGFSTDRNSRALDDLSDALNALENQLGLGRRQSGYSELDEIRARQEQLSARQQPLRKPRYAQANPSHDDDLRAQMRAMREDLARERQFAAAPARPAMPAPSGNSEISTLKADIEALKSDVLKLAREDSIRDLTDRWSVLEQEFAQLPQKLGSRDDLMSVADRIATLQDTVSSLPQSGNLSAIEQQLHTLASSVEQLAYQSQTTANGSFSGAHLEALDNRLNEITHAIAMMAQSGDQRENLDRIEMRIGALADQLNNAPSAPAAFDTSGIERHISALAERLDAVHEAARSTYDGQALSDVNQRLAQLSEAVTAIASQAAHDHGPLDPALAGMAAHLEQIAAKVARQEAAAGEAAAHITTALDTRMEELATYLEQRQPAGIDSTGSIERLENRINDIAAMMSQDRMPETRGVSADAIAGLLDDRMQALAAQIKQQETMPVSGPSTDAIAGLLDDRMQALAAHIEQLNAQPASAGVVDMSGLEQQIAMLSSQLSSVTQPADNGALIERMASLESQVARSDDDIMAAATHAAQAALSQMAPGQDRDTLNELAQRLNELDELARDSNDRNSQTFEAIHDTLLKVVEHLSGLESAMDMPRPAASAPEMPSPDYAPMMDVQAPPMAMEEPATTPYPPGFGEMEEAPQAPPAAARARAAGRSPRQAAELAAMAALNNDETMFEMPDVPAADVTKTKSKPAAKSKKSNADVVDEVMLEPGSGTPDLASILQRVRDENNEPRSAPAADVHEDTSKSDFIAAARRAAQAAAADMTIAEKNQAAHPKEGRFAGVTDIFKAKRKPILMGAGAILLAILAIPAVSALFGGGDNTQELAFNEPAPMIEMQDGAVDSANGGLGQFGDDALAVDQTENIQLGEPLLDAGNGADIDLPLDEPETVTTPQPGDEATLVEQVALTVPQGVGSVMLQEAVQVGDPVAMFVVGEALAGRAGANLDANQQAAQWYEKAAQLGFAPAQYRLGSFFEKGTAGTQDVAEAKLYYQLAADQGNASAMHNLGSLMANGQDGQPDMESASRWFHRAAELGVRDSQFNLGILYGLGQGVQRDLKESYKWFAIAANSGDAIAAERLREVEAQLSPEDLSFAEGAVKLWQPKPLDSLANTVDIPSEWKVTQERTAATTAAVSPPPEDMKKAITNIQAILNNAGYDAGPVDGLMGGKTRQAIIQFQKDNGMEGTGNIDKALVERLLEFNKTAASNS